MKLDMTDAWNDALAMIKANREVLAVIAGVFFFLPSLAAMFFLAEPGQIPPDADTETAWRIMADYFSQNAVPLVLLTLISAVGFIALLALLRHDSKPTVGEAITTGFIGLLPYIGVQLLVALGGAVLAGVLVFLPVAVGLGPLAAFTVLIVLVILIYVMIKTSLVMPVIAIERDMNPVSVLQRSWSLTKGNSMMVFLFYLLLGVAFAVISVIVEVIFGLLFGLLSNETAATIANGTVSGLVSAAGSLVFAAVLAAVHRQLAGSAVDLRK